MLYNLILSDEAIEDIDRAQAWYEEQRAGLGDELIAGIEQALLLITANPFLGGYYKRNIRRSTVNRFPYIILYFISDSDIRIISVFHTGRNPII
jgi:plasmid stabilization system protein ParE